MPRLLLLASLLLALVPAMAQHEGHAPAAPAPAPAAQPAAPVPSAAPPAPQAHQMPAHEGMTHHSGPLGLPHNRFGSGTSWMPDSSPMYGVMDMGDEWEIMYHGAAHLGYDKMNGPRGASKPILPNWAMGMARKNVSENDQWLLKAMVSLDPLTVGGSGYPLLFQTGETWRGEPLQDHQHPHNYFSELAAQYTHAFSRRGAGFIYAGIVGEPALGPPTFMHRTLALDNPFAPIGHHWTDATHIAFGVVTLGYQTPEWKIEASTFNGREPGENRFRIKSPEFDSVSGRLSWNPSPNWALQASHAYLHSPEALHPDENVHRTTASAIYNRPLSGPRNFQGSLVWGRNRLSGENGDSYLLDLHRKRDGGWSPYLRYEYAQKTAEELVLPATFDPHREFNLQQLTLGVARDLPLRGDYQWGVGLQGILNFVPDALQPVYGNDPTGWLIYVRVHPKQM